MFMKTHPIEMLAAAEKDTQFADAQKTTFVPDLNTNPLPFGCII